MSLSNSALNILSLVTAIISLIATLSHAALLITLLVLYITYEHLETTLEYVLRLLNKIIEDGSTLTTQQPSIIENWYKNWDLLRVEQDELREKVAKAFTGDLKQLYTFTPFHATREAISLRSKIIKLREEIVSHAQSALPVPTSSRGTQLRHTTPCITATGRLLNGPTVAVLSMHLDNGSEETIVFRSMRPQGANLAQGCSVPSPVRNSECDSSEVHSGDEATAEIYNEDLRHHHGDPNVQSETSVKQPREQMGINSDIDVDLNVEAIGADIM